MDDKIQKAYNIANYMTTLANQKTIINQEFKQNLCYFVNGHTFTVTTGLITFIKTLIDLGHTDFIIVDDNENPIEIKDLNEFLDNIINQYFMAVNSYHTKFSQLKKSRNVESLVQL
jgi:hypothetical protein